MNCYVAYDRLLSRGEIDGSNGGLYNPGWAHNGQLLVRREVDYTWEQPSYPTMVDLETKIAKTLTPVGFPEKARLEDCRIFKWRDHTLVSHVEYVRGPGATVYQRLSKIEDWNLVAWDRWEQIPTPRMNVEKNWVLASDGDDLFCVYSLDPLIVWRRVRQGIWKLVQHYQTGLTRSFGKPLHNSTHLVPFDGGYLGFWHYILDRSYVTGAYWLNTDWQLLKRTPILIDGSWVQDDVFKRGVVYVSHAEVLKEHVRLYYGEGDAHCGVATLATFDLRRLLVAADKRLGIR